jgi:hypothetical protein
MQRCLFKIFNKIFGINTCCSFVKEGPWRQLSVWPKSTYRAWEGKDGPPCSSGHSALGLWLHWWHTSVFNIVGYHNCLFNNSMHSTLGFRAAISYCVLLILCPLILLGHYNKKVFAFIFSFNKRFLTKFVWHTPSFYEFLLLERKKLSKMVHVTFTNQFVCVCVCVCVWWEL